MKGWDNSDLLLPLLISNLVGFIILFSCWKYQRIGRLLIFLLFVWAGCINWYTATNNPSDYIDYANYAFLPFYKSFIRGWFGDHILLMVGFIASCQLLIGISMLMKGFVFKTGTIGGMLFLIGIIPLGVGSGFPFPIIGAIAFYLLFKKNEIDFVWKNQIKKMAFDS